MKIRCFEIKWDTTDDEHPDGQEVSLPSEVVLDVADDFDIEQETADRLSDDYGWCVFGFEVEPHQ